MYVCVYIYTHTRTFLILDIFDASRYRQDNISQSYISIKQIEMLDDYISRKIIPHHIRQCLHFLSYHFLYD